MENNKKLDLKIKINRGRYNLIFIVITSIINIFTISSGSELILPYSSAISNYAVAFTTKGSSGERILGLIIACTVLLAFMMCYSLSKSKAPYLIISLSIIIADTLALLAISFSEQSISNLFNVLDILIHILAAYYILNAIKAYKSLINLGEELMNSSDTSETTPVSNNTENSLEDIVEDNEAQTEEEEEEEEEEEIDKPIREYIDDSTAPLVSGKYKGLEIFAVIRNGNAELVINNYVCDELNVIYLSEFQLRTIVNDIDIVFDYKRTYGGDAMYLYANNELLDSLGRS